MCYTDFTTNTNYPKTLIIRNHQGGMIWQIYHVNNYNEAEILSNNATKNGFYAISLEDKRDDKETFPDWRDNCSEDLKKVLT